MSMLAPWKRKPTRIANRGPVSSSDDFPFALGRLRDEFDRMIDEFSRNWPSLSENGNWKWDVDIEDGEKEIVVRAEAPGFEAEDFDVQVAEGRLTLRASHKSETKAAEGKPAEYHARECYESVVLPAEVDADKVDAKYHNGVLTISLPKTEQSRAKRIAVSAG